MVIENRYENEEYVAEIRLLLLHRSSHYLNFIKIVRIQDGEKGSQRFQLKKLGLFPIIVRSSPQGKQETYGQK